MSSIQDIERAYYTAVLGVPIDTYQTINDLRVAFFNQGPPQTAEQVRDTIAAALVQGTGVTIAVDDAANTITISASGGGGATDPEIVRDTIGTALVQGTNITITVNDAGDTITIATTATVNSTDAQLRDRSTHTGTQSADTIVDGATNKAYTATEKTKLAGIATGATANATDAQLRDRATHTGTQAFTTLSGTATIAQMPAGNLLYQAITTGNAASTARPTARTDICVHWIGSNAANPPANAISGDLWDYT
jgi:predicted enzyme related to lactoylglutathione lyase